MSNAGALGRCGCFRVVQVLWVGAGPLSQRKRRQLSRRESPACQKASLGGVGGPAGPLTVIVSRGFAARAGRFRHLPKPFLTFFTAISLG